jgi:hypothetical protein
VFVASNIQHEKRMGDLLMSSVARPALPYFFFFLKNGTNFGEKKLLNIKCVLIFSTNYRIPKISHSGVDKNSSFFGCHAVLTGTYLP